MQAANHLTYPRSTKPADPVVRAEADIFKCETTLVSDWLYCYCEGCRKRFLNAGCLACKHGRRWHRREGCHHGAGRIAPDGSGELRNEVCRCDQYMKQR